MKNRPSSAILYLLTFIAGAAVGLFLVTIAVWADLEAAFYGFDRLASAGLTGFECPLLMSAQEGSTISLRISNTTSQLISPSVKAVISTPGLPLEFNENIRLAPGETVRLEWPVGPENVDLGNFIFAKVLLYSSFPLPSREASCGIFILGLPGSGKLLLPVLILACLVGMGWGLYRLYRMRASNGWLDRHLGSLTFLALLVLGGLVVSSLGGWFPSLLMLVLAFLIIVILVTSFVMTERKR